MQCILQNFNLTIYLYGYFNVLNLYRNQTLPRSFFRMTKPTVLFTNVVYHTKNMQHSSAVFQMTFECHYDTLNIFCDHFLIHNKTIHMP